MIIPNLLSTTSSRWIINNLFMTYQQLPVVRKQFKICNSAFASELLEHFQVCIFSWILFIYPIKTIRYKQSFLHLTNTSFQHEKQSSNVNVVLGVKLCFLYEKFNFQMADVDYHYSMLWYCFQKTCTAVVLLVCPPYLYSLIVAMWCIPGDFNSSECSTRERQCDCTTINVTASFINRIDH